MQERCFINILFFAFAGVVFSGCFTFLRPYIKKDVAPELIAATAPKNEPANPKIYLGKAKKYFLVGLNKELMEFRSGDLTVFFEPGIFEGFFLEKKDGRCLIHRLSAYDLGGDGKYNSVYLDRHLFYKSTLLSGKISIPEEFTEGEAHLFLDMANILVNEYKKIFSDKDIETAYLTNVKTVHDLVLSFYFYEAYPASCQDYSGRPDLGLMRNFFPAADSSGK